MVILDNLLVIKNFTKRANIPNEGFITSGKSITKCKHLKQLDLHSSALNSEKNNKNIINSNNEILENDSDYIILKILKIVF